MTTAGIIVIGNEVLSGKVDEANARLCIKELRAIGVQLCRISVIRDDEEEIAAEVRAMSPKFDHVLTSGGVGPTHDDVTIVGLARGLGVPLVRHPGLVELIHRVYPPERITDRVLRMADVPEGTDLVDAPGLKFPVVRARNVFILPGVPEFFEIKLRAILSVLATDRPFYLKEIFVSAPEEKIADALEDTQREIPGLEIGSYPRFDAADHRVKITLESRNLEAVERALELLLSRLNASDIVRVHR
ncbi:MAG: competence/damage-inducible protein A [Deltaproteobacteria bacterium]|nr:competence/damage-inducible protein A [Deltaproteobacteria bacterium]